MGILTKLKKEDFYSILSDYNIGRYKSSKHVKHAYSTTVFILKTTRGKYVLKVFAEDKPGYLEFQMRVLDYLRRKNLPVQKVMKSRRGRTIFEFHGKKLAIFKYIEGGHDWKLNSKLIKDIARKQARINRALLRLKVTGKFSMGRKFLLKPLDFGVKRVGKYNIVKYEKAEIKETRKIDFGKIRRSVIHSDFHGINLLVRKNKLAAVLDWDEVDENYLAHDVAVFIAQSFIRGGEVKCDAIQLYLKEYQKVLKLRPEEKKAIYYFVQRRCISAAMWCEMQKRKHKAKQVGEWAVAMVKKYLVFDKIPLEEFVKLF